MVLIVPARLVDLNHFLGYYVESLDSRRVTPFTFIIFCNRDRSSFFNYDVRASKSPTLRLHAVKPGNLYDDYWCSLWDRVNSSTEPEQRRTGCVAYTACRESFHENQIKTIVIITLYLKRLEYLHSIRSRADCTALP